MTRIIFPVFLRHVSSFLPQIVLCLHIQSISKIFMMQNKIAGTKIKPEDHIASYDEKGFVIHKAITDENFKPKGAIAFFVVLLLLCAAIWYSIYYIQLTRQ